jgi:hypothetical protein
MPVPPQNSHQYSVRAPSAASTLYWPSRWDRDYTVWLLRVANRVSVMARLYHHRAAVTQSEGGGIHHITCLPASACAYARSRWTSGIRLKVCGMCPGPRYCCSDRHTLPFRRSAMTVVLMSL